MNIFPIVSGVDDTHKFLGNDTHTDYFRLLLRDGNYLLVGGRWVNIAILIDDTNFLLLQIQITTRYNKKNLRYKWTV